MRLAAADITALAFRPAVAVAIADAEAEAEAVAVAWALAMAEADALAVAWRFCCTIPNALASALPRFGAEGETPRARIDAESAPILLAMLFT